jgi:hypothetical protein
MGLPRAGRDGSPNRFAVGRAEGGSLKLVTGGLGGARQVPELVLDGAAALLRSLRPDPCLL